MCSIKWDEKNFETTGVYYWIYNNGHVESTNYIPRRTVKIIMQINYQPKTLNNRVHLNSSRINKREFISNKNF